MLHLNYNFQAVRRICVRVRTAFIQMLGSNIYYYIIYGLHTLLSHTVPCILLVIFTWKLIAAIREADKRHAYLTSNSVTKKRYVMNADVESSDLGDLPNNPPAKSFKKAARMRNSITESKRIQGLKQVSLKIHLFC